MSVHRADLLDAREIDALAGAVRATHLLHFAWIATPGEYWRSAENYRWLAASTHLLKAFQRGGGVRAVMAGSCAEYDWSRASVCDERTTPLASGPTLSHATPYAECKIAMSRTLEEFGRAHRLSTAWGRIFFQFGPGEDPRRLVSSVIVDLLCGREAACTLGTQVRSFLHVDDVGAAFAALLGAEVEGAVNVGSADPIAIADLLGRIASASVDPTSSSSAPVPCRRRSRRCSFRIPRGCARRWASSRDGRSRPASTTRFAGGRAMLAGGAGARGTRGN